MLFDPRSYAVTYARAGGIAADTHGLWAMIWPHLADRLQDIKQNFLRTLIVGDRSLDALWPALTPEKIARDGITIISRLPDHPVLPIEPGTFDLVMMVGDLAWVDDVPLMLMQLRAALGPGGVFLGMVPGGATLHELRSATLIAESEFAGSVTPRVHPMLEARTLAGLMQGAGFRLPVVDTEITTADYADVTHLAHDLRAAAATNILAARPKNFMPRALWRGIQACYPKNDHGRITATFEAIYMIGWGDDAPTTTLHCEN